jgi:hypothetical protein
MYVPFWTPDSLRHKIIPMESKKSKTTVQRAFNDLQRASFRMEIMVQCGYDCLIYSPQVWEKFLATQLWEPHYQSLHYPDILREYILHYSSIPFGDSHLKMVAAIDPLRHQYLMLTVPLNPSKRSNYQVSLHLSLEQEKVIVYASTLEKVVTVELVELGIAPCDIIY